MRATLGVMLLAALPALAVPRVVVHPLAVVADDARAIDESRSDFLGQAARQAIEMVSRAEVSDALEHLGGTCLDHEGCLEKLCQSTGATYALLATLVLKGPNFVITAKVVDANGTLLKSIDMPPVPKDLLASRAPQVQAVFKTLFSLLELGGLPSVLPKKTAPVVVAQPPEVVTVPTEAPVVVPAEPSTSTPPLRIAGLVVGGAGIVAAAVGLGLAGSAASAAGGINTVKLGDKVFLTNPADASRVGPINQQGTLATGILIGAGVAVAIGVVMAVLSTDSGPRVAIAPMPDGAIVGISGDF